MHSWFSLTSFYCLALLYTEEKPTAWYPRKRKVRTCDACLPRGWFRSLSTVCKKHWAVKTTLERGRTLCAPGSVYKLIMSLYLPMEAMAIFRNVRSALGCDSLHQHPPTTYLLALSVKILGKQRSVNIKRVKEGQNVYDCDPLKTYQ